MSGFISAAEATTSPLGGGQVSKTAPLLDRGGGARTKTSVQTGY
nr:MAG TPA: hypothetical protein [Caudoviricetes sp.]